MYIHYNSNQQQIASTNFLSNTACIFDEKPQIISIRGIPIKEKFRYRVALNGEILGDNLSLEQALEKAGLEIKGVKS